MDALIPNAISEIISQIASNPAIMTLLLTIPSLEDKPSLKALPNFLLPLHAYKKHACFEIWINRNRISFYIFARGEKLLKRLRLS